MAYKTTASIEWDAVLQDPAHLNYLFEHCTEVYLDLVKSIRRGDVSIQTPGFVSYRDRIREPDCKLWIKEDNFTPNYHGRFKRKRRPELRPSAHAMSRPLSGQQYERHAIHLMMRLLCLRSNASPFTLITDDLNQRGMPLVRELVTRGLSRNLNVVFVAFERTRFNPAVSHVIAHAMTTGDQVMQALKTAMSRAQESIVIIDSMFDMLNLKGFDMNELFKLVVTQFASTLVGVYHKDMLPVHTLENAYAPPSLDLIKYMATTVINCKSFSHALAAKAAKERSLPEPTHGLLQGAEGIVQSLDANSVDGIVLETEFRRVSGRIQNETYFLRPARQSDYNLPINNYIVGTLKKEFVVLLSMHPTYSSREILSQVEAIGSELDSTFNLALTEKQKKAREGVVLPYFDAQKGEGGEGGRILYDMGSEDDFDEEEDEI